MESLHKGHRERLRAKCIKNGMESLEPHEVLELLLFYAIPRKDTNPIAHELLNKYGGNFSRVLEADVEELKMVPGIGEGAAYLLHLLPQFARYYTASKWERGVSLGTTDDMIAFAVDLCRGKIDEELIVVCLDANKCFRKYEVLERGTVNEVSIYARKVAEYAIKARAVNVLLIHNHPNGSMMPSLKDKETTKTVVRALRAISLNVIDHIIVSGNRGFSMKTEGLID